MLLLAIRTDKPAAELTLFDNQQVVETKTWHAHRELAETIHRQINDLLVSHDHKLSDISGIVCFKGPGSFTGLRIGLSVGNALSYSLGIPIVAEGGDEWLQRGAKRLMGGESDQIALPEYGASVHITKQKK